MKPPASALRVLRAAAFGVACVIAGLACVLFAVERSGLLGRLVRDGAVRALGGLGERLVIERARLRWFEPGIELRGVTFGPAGGAAALDSVRIALGASFERGVYAHNVAVDGGRVLLGQELLDSLGDLGRAKGGGEPRPGEPRRAARWPRLTARGLQADLAHPEWGDIPLGRVDLVLESDTNGRPRFEGRVLPTLAASKDDAAAVYLGGAVEQPGTLSVRLYTAGVELDANVLPHGTVLEQFRAYALRGRLALDVHATLGLDPSQKHAGELRARVTGASLRSPTSSTPVEELAAELEARWSPLPGEPWTSPRSWEALADLSGRWSSSPFRGRLRFGRNVGPDAIVNGHVRVTDLDVSHDTLAALGLERRLEQSWKALSPSGVANMSLGLRLTTKNELQLALDVENDGRSGVEVHGWAQKPGERLWGFPMPVREISGHVIALHDAARAKTGAPATLVGLFDITGQQGSQARPGVDRKASCSGTIATAGQRGGHPVLDLAFDSSGVVVDAELERAVAGLGGTEWIWPTLSPRAEAGRLAARGRLLRVEETGALTGRFDIDLDGAGLVCSLVPVQVERAVGRVSLTFDENKHAGAVFEAAGVTPTADAVRVRGRFQDDPSAPPRAPHAGLPIQALEVEADNIALRGADRNALVAIWPGLGVVLDRLSPSGKADVVFRGGTDGQRYEYGVEVFPREVQLTPETFNMPTRKIQGRVTVAGLIGVTGAQNGDGKGETNVRIAPLTGEWVGSTRVACVGEFPARGDDQIELFGAGIDLSNRALVGALRQALGGGSADAGGVDVSDSAITGRVDLRGSVRIPEAEPRTPVSQYWLQLRDNDFSTGPGGFGLAGLRGVLVQQGQVLLGESITAVLGRTPVALANARFVRRESGFELETRVSARGLPLDLEHMRYFLDPKTIEVLIEELHWRGEIDIPDASLRVVSRGDGSRELVQFKGQVLPRDMFVDIGLPLSVEGATVDVRELVYEGGSVRVWADVADLEGRLAKRRLQKARMLLTYVEPHLSVLDVAGEFEGGELRDMGSRGGPAFSVDLRGSFPFDVGLRIEGADIAGILRDLSRSDFADKGTLSGELRMTGTLARLTGISGEGNLQLSDTRLWSIPVMRDLFSQLGFDNTAVFERMRTRFHLERGVIHMDAINVYSPLLQLVGEGTLDLDGRLRHDLEVRYSLVDRLGPLTRLIYFIQNNLLRVEVRGDMERPKVLLKGALSFLNRVQSGERELPLPGLSPLPERF